MIDASMDATFIGVAIAGLFLAGIIKGVTGLGYASCALPFLVLAVGLKNAMAIVIVPAMATNVGLALLTGHLSETLRRFQWLYVAIFPGVAIGVLLLQWVAQPAAVKLLGVVIIGYGIIALTKPNMALPESWQQRLQWPTGLLNGVVTGLTGAQVMPLFPYIMALQMDTNRTVQAINLAVLVSTSLLALGLLVTGIMTSTLLVMSVAAVLPALAGTVLGNRARGLIAVAQFRRVVLGTLLLVGFIMVAR